MLRAGCFLQLAKWGRRYSVFFCSSSAKICQKPLILSTPGAFQNYWGERGLMKIPLKHLMKEESYFLSCEVTPEVLQSISNLNCPADLPPHTPVQEWHIQHPMGLLQRKHLTHSYLGEIQKFTIVSVRLSCSMASVKLLFSLDQPASVQQWLWNMSLYPWDAALAMDKPGSPSLASPTQKQCRISSAVRHQQARQWK